MYFMKIVYDLYILVYVIEVMFFYFFLNYIKWEKENKIIIIIDDFYYNIDIF